MAKTLSDEIDEMTSLETFVDLFMEFNKTKDEMNEKM